MTQICGLPDGSTGLGLFLFPELSQLLSIQLLSPPQLLLSHSSPHLLTKFSLALSFPALPNRPAGLHSRLQRSAIRAVCYQAPRRSAAKVHHSFPSSSWPTSSVCHTDFTAVTSGLSDTSRQRLSWLLASQFT